jgi:hypothetical protein
MPSRVHPRSQHPRQRALQVLPVQLLGRRAIHLRLLFLQPLHLRLLLLQSLHIRLLDRLQHRYFLHPRAPRPGLLLLRRARLSNIPTILTAHILSTVVIGVCSITATWSTPDDTLVGFVALELVAMKVEPWCLSMNNLVGVIVYRLSERVGTRQQLLWESVTVFPNLLVRRRNWFC